MSDDIVTRLRDMANSVIEKTDPRFQWLVDAADEIEDLRAELEEFKRQYALLKAELKQWQALCDTYYHKLALEPNNTFHFISGYRYLASGGK